MPGDGNCDERLSAADLSAIVMRIGQETGEICPLADANQDGIVDGTDLLLVIRLELFVLE